MGSQQEEEKEEVLKDRKEEAIKEGEWIDGKTMADP